MRPEERKLFFRRETGDGRRKVGDRKNETGDGSAIVIINGRLDVAPL